MNASTRKPDSVSQNAQRERFEQAARELGVELDEEKLKEALRKMGCHDTVVRDDKLGKEHE